MPSRRELIRMSAAEQRAYLLARHRIVLVGNGPGGLPHPVPMNFGLDAQDRIVMSSFATSQKVRNLERDPRATLLAEDGGPYAELKGVILYCNAEIIRDPAAMVDVQSVIGNGLMAALPTGDPRQEQVRASMTKRVVLRFTPVRTVSWDHAKLAGLY
jgi:nitroimidazol reductase NimA-like FMN-containing flavoprotein (pyridoxamine 5'-phosphate oxidase superfamily)